MKCDLCAAPSVYLLLGVKQPSEKETTHMWTVRRSDRFAGDKRDVFSCRGGSTLWLRLTDDATEGARVAFSHGIVKRDRTQSEEKRCTEIWTQTEGDG